MTPIDGAWCAVEEHGARLHVRWGGAGFDALKADFKRTFWRHQDATYLPKHKAWSVPASHRTLLQCWVSAWFAPDMLSWDDESDTDADDTDEEPAGAHYTPGVPAALADDYRLLCLTPDAPPELVSAARRVLALLHHPDHGGDEVTMKRINMAADAILEALERRTDYVAF
jgi:hypothetical protein